MATLAAGINFGKPLTEFIMESDENGIVSSCRNVVTGIEYVGGGGSSDFSTAEVTLEGVVGVTGVFLYEDEGTTDLATYTDSETENVATIVLYQGRCYIETDTPMVDVSGNIEMTSPPNGFLITGDCTISSK